MTKPVMEPPAPAGLGESGSRFWSGVQKEFHGASTVDIALLTSACHLIDRIEQARALIAAEGMVTVNRSGRPVPHPALEIELRASGELRQLVRALGIGKGVEGETKPY